MLAPFLIMLREGLEAALVISIIASYLKQTGRARWIPAIWVGIFLAVALSLSLGAAILLVAGEFPRQAQEGFEALVGLVAVALLTWMVFWMRRAAKGIRAGLEGDVERALARPSGGALALIAIAFFAVAREGLESVFFLLAIFQQSSGPAAALGALSGLLVSVALGFTIYLGGIRLDLRRFFRVTGVLILLIAAGLLAGALRNLHEAGLWNGLQATAWDLSAALPLSSLPGTLLSALLGYHDTPTLGELLVWALYLAITLPLFLRPQKRA